MKRLIFLLSTILFFLLEITSCQIKKEGLNTNTNKIEKVALVFEILKDEISFDSIKKIADSKTKMLAYWDFEILATLKRLNKTTEKIELTHFIVFENFEITNLKKEPKEELIRHYDYSIVFDPENYESDMIRKIMPTEYEIDTLNLSNDFRFYLSKPDTLLIRVKEFQLGKEVYSNWDTLVVR